MEKNLQSMLHQLLRLPMLDRLFVVEKILKSARVDYQKELDEAFESLLQVQPPFSEEGVIESDKCYRSLGNLLEHPQDIKRSTG